MFRIRHSVGVASTFLAAVFLAACAPAQYVATAPSPSGLKYEIANAAAPTTLAVIDARRADDKLFSFGILPAELKIAGTAIEPIPFLAEHVSKELASRGVPATTRVGENPGAPTLQVKAFRIQNHRVNAYSPFVTLTFLSADIDTAAGPKRLGVFVKRGKVPVWSFSEVLDPIFNQPLSIAVQELSSKIANATYGFAASETKTDELIKKLSGPRAELSFLDVYALGFTNNRRAIPKLVELTKDSDEYVRLAAISSLGTIGAVEQYDLLKSIYGNKDALWQDRAMAMKSIGDLGTADGRAFMDAEIRRLGTVPVDNDSRWTTQLLALYL
jgi:HEAT repeats